MEHLLLAIDQGTIDWSRAQFALTSMYHWLFVPLTLGLAVIMGIMETCYYRTGKDFWRTASKFWQRIFGINFAIGIATGIILEFEFGTNWSNYSWFVGDIFGAPLAVEGILAFFMESTFVAVMFFGWNKVSKGFHLASTWLTGLGATISAWWILVANSWMQDPVGCSFNPETMRNEMTSFADVALSPFAIDKFTHTVTSSWLLGAAFTVGVGCWYLLRNKHTELARQSIKIGAIVGLVSSLLAAFTGDNSAYMVAQTQPMKLAAMEALYTGGNAQGLTAIAGVTEQPNIEASPKEAKGIKIPNMLSLLATHDANGFVPGVHDIINGYTDHKGVKQPSLAEKMARGRNAIKALKDFRAGKNKEANRKVLERDMKYFGYGYIKNAQQTVPHIPITFWSFRIMVGLGSLFVLAFIVIIFFVYKKDIAKAKWLHYVGIALIPLAFIASESGWIVAEMGRQPWTIQDMLPTWVSVSDISSGGVAFTFFLFLVLFTTMLAVEVSIMCKQIKKGPEL
ncbi:cytochrome ubiquinol oxidase subunit I [Prevotella amnii]|jgi:putative cytochrome d ubiquinol oxidase, subunit I|uniref:Bacterial cytochrome ubiquinol oxidase n=2 Tax=Prevotella amnii TaxID=419005 RepID=E1GTX9_9BACT|nr:cytochrome ubiquinol oxidase subunit I [Prevotella amnii]EFN91918.1 bacterial cytochrome ubiquinol oxidase [Prevotella amnii CRIS 21A-A]KXB77513.1 putative cytochrome D ubiquinol oxidase subunit I [Prevotella amnii]